MPFDRLRANGVSVTPGEPPVTEVEIFTDGACKGNPGPGGWAAIVRSGGREKELSGGEPDTTNNRMELLAAIRALEALKRSCRVALYTDSNYVRDGITKWIHGWRRNGWRTADRKPVKNAELWQALIDAAAPHRIEWHWVRGHAGHPENERADRLACAEASAAATRLREDLEPDRNAPATKEGERR